MVYSSTMRILVVEDDHKIVRAIKKGLEQESFAVDLAFNGKDGYGFSATVSYDLIILDRMLPELDGLKICQILRKKGANVPILILTAKDAVENRIEGLNAGAGDYLVKPFSFEELLARIRALLRRSPEMKSNVLQTKDLTLNPATFEVKRDGRAIKLSAKEFALLEYLMRSPDRILTKTNIISHVWDYDADILPNTVEVYIGYLRNKIDKPFTGKRELIETIRGFGYRIKTT